MNKISSLIAGAFVFGVTATASNAQDVNVYLPATEHEEQTLGPFFNIADKKFLFSDGSVLEIEELGKLTDDSGFLIRLKNLNAVSEKVRNAMCGGEATHFIWTSGFLQTELTVLSVFVLLKSDVAPVPADVKITSSDSCGHLSFAFKDGKIGPEALDGYFSRKGIPKASVKPQEQNDAGDDAVEKQVDNAVRTALRGDNGRDLVQTILRADNVGGLTPDELEKAEQKLLAYVKPLPAAQTEENRDGYAALARLFPENSTYSAKADGYARKIEENRRSIVKRMKKKTDEFRGITFYHHPSEPRYADTRSYVLPYIGEKAGRIAMRFVVHYTADDWLFIENASFKVDGEIIPLSAGEWMRDNDSEIWEWVDLPDTPSIRTLMEKIANSEETIIRFEGKQYYNNVTVKKSDKQAIKDMFLLEEVLKEGL